MYLMFYVNLLFFVCIKKQFTFFFSFHLGVSRSCSSVSGYNNCVKTKVMGIKGVSCSCSTDLCNGSGAIGQSAALVAMGLIVVIKLLQMAFNNENVPCCDLVINVSYTLVQIPSSSDLSGVYVMCKTIHTKTRLFKNI